MAGESFGDAVHKDQADHRKSDIKREKERKHKQRELKGDGREKDRLGLVLMTECIFSFKN